MVDLEGFRKLVRDGIVKALELDPYHKSFEGRIAYAMSLPGYFDGDEPERHTLTLFCYVLGPSRHYSWEGTTAKEVLARATADVQRWIAELSEER
jgi:hypothetical protein